MKEKLISSLLPLSEEESLILSGAPLDEKKYFADGVAIITESRLFGGRRAIGLTRHTRLSAFPEHKHSYLEVMIVLSGSITHEIADRAVTLKPGDILFLPKHTSHSIRKTEKTDIGLNIMLSDGFMSGVGGALSGTVFSDIVKENAAESGAGSYLHFTSCGSPAIENLIENILLELTSGKDGRIAAKAVELLMLYLSREGDTLLVGGGGAKDKRTERMRAITDYIKANAATATLGELAGVLYLCPQYLSKIIREYFGVSFKELVVRERLALAKTLITDTDMKISDAIRAVGYENESYFHKEFKKRYGVTPLGARKAK